MSKEKVETIVSILENSNIVWPRYGDQTIEELAAKIAAALDENEEG